MQSSRFVKGNVVKLHKGINLPIPAETIMMVRSVFTFKDAKEDARKTFCHLDVADDTPVYFCSDCHGRTYFIPESYFVDEPTKEGDAPSQRLVNTLTTATPCEELTMVTLEEVRNLAYRMFRYGNRGHYRNNQPKQVEDVEDDDDEKDDDAQDDNAKQPKKRGWFR